MNHQGDFWVGLVLGVGGLAIIAIVLGVIVSVASLNAVAEHERFLGTCLEALANRRAPVTFEEGLAICEGLWENKNR